jgi:hypothetical protein
VSNYGSEIRPFRVEIPHEALDDLRDRLDRVRWTTEVPGPAPEAYGVPRRLTRYRTAALCAFSPTSFITQRDADATPLTVG